MHKELTEVRELLKEREDELSSLHKQNEALRAAMQEQKKNSNHAARAEGGEEMWQEKVRKKKSKIRELKHQVEKLREKSYGTSSVSQAQPTNTEAAKTEDKKEARDQVETLTSDEISHTPRHHVFPSLASLRARGPSDELAFYLFLVCVLSEISFRSLNWW